MRQRPTPPDLTAIERQEQLQALCRQCRGEGRFAFDTEFVMEDRFEAEVCLIQIATRSTVAVIDPFLTLDLRPVWRLICDREVESVVHAGQEDLSLCVQHAGQVPRRIYDVQIAAGLAGYDYPMSLQKLVQTTLHIRLHKSKTLTDWRRRPLKPDQIRYAAEDASYLLPAREKLHERLSQRKRLSWAEEEFARFEEMSLYRHAEEEKLLRLKGSGALKGRQLAVVRELVAWREKLAKELDRPVRAVLKDHLLVEIAKLELSTFKEVRELRGLNLSARHVRELCKVVEAALETPSNHWPIPTPRETETPKEAALVALMTAVMRSYCLEHDLSYGLLASKRTIREVVRQCAAGGSAETNDAELLRGWRGDAVGTMVKDVLSGRGTVRVESRDGRRVVHVSRGGSRRPG